MQIPLSIVGVEHDPDTPSLLRTLEVCIGIGTSDTGIEASGTLGASDTRISTTYTYKQKLISQRWRDKLQAWSRLHPKFRYKEKDVKYTSGSMKSKESNGDKHDACQKKYRDNLQKRGKKVQNRYTTWYQSQDRSKIKCKIFCPHQLTDPSVNKGIQVGRFCWVNSWKAVIPPVGEKHEFTGATWLHRK